MSKQFDEKLKILYILKILTEQTDADHRLSTSQLIDKLSEFGISAERKSIYRDLDTLADFGYDIERGHNGCCLAGREFELPELKLLVDAVQASKFISQKKSRDIIKKLGTVVSRYDAAKLNRGVYVSERVKAGAPAVLYTIDGLHEAINTGKCVNFKYLEWTPDKKKRPRRHGMLYHVSPWGLLWNDENYYLIAYDSVLDIIKHFRVDKIAELQVTEEKRQGQAKFKNFDMGIYSKKVFGMFGGDDDTVTLEFTEEMCGVIFDRFGTDMTVFNLKNGNYCVSVPVKVSNNLLSWVIGFGGKIKITAPDHVIEKMNILLNIVSEDYQ